MQQNKNEEQKKHGKHKLILKIVGGVLALAGAVLIIVGFVNMFTSIRQETFPDLFFLLIIGFPCLAFGAAALMFGFRKEVANYMRQESAPVFNQFGQQIAPGISAIAGAAQNSQNVCKTCGTANEAESKFCRSCGAPLTQVCANCGETVEADSAFCNKCGQKLQ